MPPILSVEDLSKRFPVRRGLSGRTVGWVRAVDGVRFEVQPGEVFGIVGESGCGKSTLAKTILGIYRPTGGRVIFRGRTISGLPPRETRKVRREIQYVYQDPGASLDPWWTAGSSLMEPLRVHTDLGKAAVRAQAEEMLAAVGLERAHLSRYPHELSGGQQRRLGLARILTLNPKLVIFDEPTAGLDVSVQAAILSLMRELQAKFDLTYIIISHDLGIVRLMCHRIAVMYLGVIVEMGETETIFSAPKHPYTKALLAAVPRLSAYKEGREILVLEGEPPRPDRIPAGCRFRPRCPYAREDPCARREPALEEAGVGRLSACHFHRDL